MQQRLQRPGWRSGSHLSGRRATFRTATCKTRAAAGAGKQAEATAKPDPFAERTTYNDNAVDRFFIKLYSQKMADQLDGVPVPEDATYDDFVRISKEIMRGRGSRQQREVVREVLRSLMPREAPAAFRKLFPPTRWSAEFNALIASLAFFWLVGDSELREADVVVGGGGGIGGSGAVSSSSNSSSSGGSSGGISSSSAAAVASTSSSSSPQPEPVVTRWQRSVVHIKKCRYLEASGCVGMCVNMCKIPTQSFFTDEFGLPLTMNPNFEDLSCEMIFGQPPPPLEQDPVYAQPCFATHCSLASRPSEPCPKVDTERSAASLGAASLGAAGAAGAAGSA